MTDPAVHALREAKRALEPIANVKFLAGAALVPDDWKLSGYAGGRSWELGLTYGDIRRARAALVLVNDALDAAGVEP